MKNKIVPLFAFTFCLHLLLPAFGGADDTLISFSTPGPDKYLDGTTVKDGECYALVWTKAGAAFGGFTADGKSVDDGSKVLVFAPLAKGGRCPSTLFEIDAELAKQHAGGAYALYLVDTRLASGALGGVDAKGVPVAVNGWGEVKVRGEGEQLMGSNSTVQPSTSNLQPVSVTTKSALPANTPKPQITAIKLVGDKVFLTVKNTLPCLQYAANEVKVNGEVKVRGEGEQLAGATSQTFQTSQTSQTSTQGAASADAEITVIAPKKGDGGFYSVGRK